MANNGPLKSITSVRVVTTLLVAFALLYGAQFIALIPRFLSYFSWAHHPETEKYFNSGLGAVASLMLSDVLYLLILYQVFRLLLKVGKGDPFDPVNPRRIRKVAYGAFGIAAITLLYEVIMMFVLFKDSYDPNVTTFHKILNVLVRSAQMALFGLGILIIAKILESGVRLQQEQNLTI
jgi:hypothetical protein